MPRDVLQASLARHGKAPRQAVPKRFLWLDYTSWQAFHHRRKRRARTVQMAFHRALGKVEHQRDVSNTTLLQVEQRDDLSLGLRQPIDALSDLEVMHANADCRFVHRIERKCFPMLIVAKGREACISRDRV